LFAQIKLLHVKVLSQTEQALLRLFTGARPLKAQILFSAPTPKQGELKNIRQISVGYFLLGLF